MGFTRSKELLCIECGQYCYCMLLMIYHDYIMLYTYRTFLSIPRQWFKGLKDGGSKKPWGLGDGNGWHRWLDVFILHLTDDPIGSCFQSPSDHTTRWEESKNYGMNEQQNQRYFYTTKVLSYQQSLRWNWGTFQIMLLFMFKKWEF